MIGNKKTGPAACYLEYV